MKKKYLRFSLLAIFVGVFIPPSLYADESNDEIRLVLQLTVDGLRADLLARYADRFGDDGFLFLKRNGAVFANAHYQHANTETIVGHATLATGAQPSVHGMTGNVWFDAETGELSYNIEDAEHPLIGYIADKFRLFDVVCIGAVADWHSLDNSPVDTVDVTVTGIAETAVIWLKRLFHTLHTGRRIYNQHDVRF